MMLYILDTSITKHQNKYYQNNVMNPLPLIVSLLLWLQPASSLSSASTSTSASTQTHSTTKVVWFRNHALRIRDNDALHTAIEESQAAAAAATVATNVKNVFSVYLWSSENSGSPVDTTNGGTARDVFVANALDNSQSYSYR